jgi:hypothetical protein
MTSMTEISIAECFSLVPAGRYTSDGPFSGQVFRESILLPALSQYELVRIDLDGTEGYGSSFLEEAFGGLVRIHGFRYAELKKRLTFKSDEDPSVTEEIDDYLNRADAIATSSTRRT